MRYKVGMYGVSRPNTGVGEHILNICKRLPELFQADIVADPLVYRPEAWAFEPVSSILLAMHRSKHHIIHSHNEAAYFQRLKRNVKTVTTIHLHPQRVLNEYLTEAALGHVALNPVYISKLLINRAQWGRMLAISDKVISTSANLIPFLSKLHGLPVEKFKYIPNGVDASTHEPSERKEELQALFVGEWSWRKGVHYLLRAFEAAKKEIRNLKLVIVSSRFPNDPRLLAPGLQDSITVLRSTTRFQLIELYQRSAFLLLPSLAETTPLVMLESMSCGTPVIAFPSDGIREVIDHGRNGLLVPQRDSIELTKSILKLGGDPSYARRLGVNAHETALKFDWAKIANETAQVYLEALGIAG